MATWIAKMALMRIRSTVVNTKALALTRSFGSDPELFQCLLFRKRQQMGQEVKCCCAVPVHPLGHLNKPTLRAAAP